MILSKNSWCNSEQTLRDVFTSTTHISSSVPVVKWKRAAIGCGKMVRVAGSCWFAE